jgi:hypothetical protein
VVHLADDVRGSQRLRAVHLGLQRALERALPDRSALFIDWVNKDAVGPLHLRRDLVVLDPTVAAETEALRLAEALLRQGRRVFVLPHGLPPRVLRELSLAGRAMPALAAPSLGLVELRPS